MAEVVKVAPHRYNGERRESEVLFDWDGDDNFLIDVTVSLVGAPEPGEEMEMVTVGAIGYVGFVTKGHLSLQLTEAEAHELYAALGRAIA